MGSKLKSSIILSRHLPFKGKAFKIHITSRRHFENYVQQKFFGFMNEQMQEWVNLGVLKKWNDVKSNSDSNIPLVVSPLGIEPNKPRAIWDGRYVNEFCGDFPFHMDNAAKVAEVAWPNICLFFQARP